MGNSGTLQKVTSIKQKHKNNAMENADEARTSDWRD